MKENITIQEITKQVEATSTNYEKCNTDLKRKYILWNIEVFNTLASHVSVREGTFGTGYPFYALDNHLQGTLPIIPEQVRYNRQLVKDGEPFQKSIWLCKSCLEEKYSTMPDLKKICKPCPNMPNTLKPRKIINRLPDTDMWLVCKDGCTNQAQTELTELFKQYNMHTSDLDPIKSIEEISFIAEKIKQGIFPKILLPIDAHIIEYSVLKELIKAVPKELEKSVHEGIKPYLPITPKSYRKEWQFDDKAYNFIFDYLASFTPFHFSSELEEMVKKSRIEIASTFSPEEAFDILMSSATEAAFRRFQTPELEERFLDRIACWQCREQTCSSLLKSEEEFAR